jgi:hypothetical protein
MIGFEGLDERLNRALKRSSWVDKKDIVGSYSRVVSGAVLLPSLPRLCKDARFSIEHGWHMYEISMNSRRSIFALHGCQRWNKRGVE